MDVRLPPPLAGAIASIGREASAAARVDGARRLSAGYRAGAASDRVIGTATAASAYAFARLPATYAALVSAFGRLSEEVPDFEPRRLVDLGAGPGTASWAAMAVFPGLTSIAMIERNPYFLALARRLASSGPAALADADIRPGDLTSLGALSDRDCDVAVLGYALTELEPKAGEALVLRLLGGCARVVVIVEPGTPRDYGRLMAIRRTAIAAGARAIAPCPHDGVCPLADGDWCHFSVRLPRRREHMRLKAASVPFEDERYGYLILTTDPTLFSARRSRILRPPEADKAGIAFRLCRADGHAATALVPRRDREGYRQARHLDWGDGFGEAAPEAAP